MAIVLYEIPTSPPCRAVIMTARCLGIELEKKQIDFVAKEHLKPEFVKLNPQHTVPTLVDNGFILWESRAIMTYLVNKYAPDSSLYPKDPKVRAIVDRVLYFDVGTLFSAQTAIWVPLVYEGRSPEQEKLDAYKKALKHLSEMLEKTPYAAGDHITLADISLIASLSFAQFLKEDFKEYPKILSWKEKLEEEIPCYFEINEKPLEFLREYLKSKNLL